MRWHSIELVAVSLALCAPAGVAAVEALAQTESKSTAAIVAPIALAFVLGLLPIGYFLKTKWDEKKEPEPYPEGGEWDLDTLRRFDGKVNPICLGVCGLVIDCSASENIGYNEGYGKLWAGRDATYALAMLSLKQEDANKFDYKITDFTPEQHKALASWYKHFTTKYKTVGKLKEYEGWDFSTVVEESKAQTPFGAKATTDDGKEVPGPITANGGSAGSSAPAAAPAAAPPVPTASAEEPFVLRKGQRVRLKDVGKVGVLEGFNPAEKKFSVVLEESGETVFAAPTDLEKP